MKLPARYMFTAATIACIAFLLSAFVTIYFWTGAVWGILVFLVTMVPIVGYAALGGFFLDPTKTKDAIASDDSPRLRSRILGMTIPLVTASIPFVALLASWHLPQVRAAVGAAGGGLEIRPLAERALVDFEPIVARAGCRSVTALGADRSRDLVIGRLFEAQDEKLVQCLLEALPGELPGDSGLRLQMLAARWERQLWQPEVQPEQACRLADHLRQAERAGVDLASPRLLACAIGAPELPTRHCCAQSLRGAMGGAPSVAAVLPPPDRTIETSGVVGRAEMFISSPRAADPEIVALLGLDEPEYEAWSLGIGCESLRIWRNDIRERAGQAMATRLSETCSVTAPSEENVAVWTQTCTDAAAKTVDPGTFDDAICVGLNDRFKSEAIALARRDLLKAQRIAATPRERVGLFESMIGLGLMPGNLDELAIDGGLPPGMINVQNLDLLNSPAFGQLNRMPQFKQLIKMVERQNMGEPFDPKALQPQRGNSPD